MEGKTSNKFDGFFWLTRCLNCHTLYDMRINARLDSELSPKIRFLTKATGLTVTEIVKKALVLFYEQIRGGRTDPLSALQKAGFIGCASGPQDLSRNYKKALLKTWVQKHGSR